MIARTKLNLAQGNNSRGRAGINFTHVAIFLQDEFANLCSLNKFSLAEGYNSVACENSDITLGEYC